MIRGLRSMLILAAVLVGLGAYIYFVESGRPTSEEAANAKASVFDIDANAITELTVSASSGERSVLRKQDDTWRLVEPVEADTEAIQVSGLTDALAGLEIERVVEESATEIGAFGLADPRIEVDFKVAGSDEPRRLQLGEKTATGGDLYARIDDERRVFLIAAFRESAFDKKPFDFRDKSILKFDRDQVDSLELTRHADTVQATKQDDQWRLEQPWNVRADSPTLESLLTRLSTVQMKSIASEGDQDVDLATYGLADPATSVTVGAGSTRATLALGSTSDSGDLYARDLTRSIVFTVEASLLDDLTKDATQYRRKDVFDFRSWNATRLELTRDGKTLTYEKGPAEDAETENAPDTWRQVGPSAADADDDKMQTLLSRLSGLRAESFGTAADETSLDSPYLTVAVQFDDGSKQERASFGRVDDRVYASTELDDSPAVLDTARFNEMIEALDALTAGS